MRLGFLLPVKRRKPSELLKAISRQATAAGYNCVISREYPPCDWLFLYGWGGVVQQKAIRGHKGHYAAFDLGYWNREAGPDQMWRISIDGFHSPKRVMRGEHPGRDRARGLVASPQRNKDGPILLIGNGPKSQRVGAQMWSAKMCERLRKRFPEKKILFRPKPDRPAERGVRHDGLAIGDLNTELRRASLVVCRHSNVAVDACIVGTPVVCEDGAAASIYPRLENWKDQPSIELRQEFLERIGYWQWSLRDVNEGRFWPWMESQLET